MNGAAQPMTSLPARSINAGITAAHVFAASAATLTMADDDNVRSGKKETAVHHDRCAYETT